MMSSNDPQSPAPTVESPVALPPVEVAGHEFTLYEESPRLIADMLADIERARTRVWMETYIFADDDAGRAIAKALATRAAAGVDVRLMIDGFGSFSTPNSLLQPIIAAGGQVHTFHSLGQVQWGPKWFRVLNQRNHRKLLVVDDWAAYFGGMNVVDQSGIQTRADARQRNLPMSAGWRDVHARMVGPRTTEIADSMDRLWKRKLRKTRLADPRWSVPDFAHAGRESISFYDSRPSIKNRRPHRVLVPLIQNARHEITLSMAYFVPMGRVLRALLQARRRGVRVRVIVPGQSDVKLVQWACRHFYEYLLKRGIRIYERSDRMLHSKAMVIDGEWSVIGSCNLDARSLRMNLEFMAVIRSHALALELNRICQEEIRHSLRVDSAYCRNRNCYQRWLDRTAWAMRKWL